MLDIAFDKSPDGLVPAVAQDWRTGDVLMVAFVNRQALETAVKTGLATYWSRSRNELWTKGLTSGHVQKIREILVDCDQDAILYKVEQAGAACHTGKKTCFYRRLDGSEL